MTRAEHISVIIPVFNCDKYLADAMDSVLAQECPDIEILVIDDGSTDGSAEVARQYKDRIRYIYQDHGGAAAARNRGVDLSHGDYLCFLDADDLWAVGKLDQQLAAFNENKPLDIVFGHVEQFISYELAEDKKRKIMCPPGIMPGFLPGTMMVKRKAFLDAGYFETRWKIGEFIDWFIKACENGIRYHMLKDVFLKRRLHETNIGIRERDARIEYVRIIRAALKRKREKKV